MPILLTDKRAKIIIIIMVQGDRFASQQQHYLSQFSQVSEYLGHQGYLSCFVRFVFPIYLLSTYCRYVTSEQTALSLRVFNLNLVDRVPVGSVTIRVAEPPEPWHFYGSGAGSDSGTTVLYLHLISDMVSTLKHVFYLNFCRFLPTYNLWQKVCIIPVVCTMI